MNDQQWAEAVALAIQRFHNGTTTEEQMSAEIATATANWPTRTLSNAGLAIKISRSLASLTGLVETVGPPDPDMGTLGAMAFDNQALAFYGPKTEAGWGDARPIDAGPPGPALEMRASGGFIQWRVEGEASWINLIAIADLKGDKGDDGEEVSLQKTATHIQWRLGAGPWQNLAALSDLVGPKGDKGEKGDQGDVGPSPDISFTASTGAPGSSASVTKSGTLEEPVFALTVPRGDVGPVGGDAWTPVLANVSDGERRVQQIVDWFGGDGTKPDSGKYIGSSGLVDTAAEATDIRGAGGSGSGDVMGPASSVDGALVAFDGSTGTKIKAGPGVGVSNAGDLLRRSDGDARYREAGSIPVADVSGLQAALDGKQSVSEKGLANGYAALGGDGKVPAAQLPAPPTVPTFATEAEVRAGNVDGKIISPKVMAVALWPVSINRTLAAAGVPFDSFINCNISLDANGTLGPPSGGYPGKSGVINVTNATGSATMAFASAYRMPKGGITIEAGVNASTRIPYMINDAGAVILFPASKWSA